MDENEFAKIVFCHNWLHEVADFGLGVDWVLFLALIAEIDSNSDLLFMSLCKIDYVDDWLVFFLL